MESLRVQRPQVLSFPEGGTAMTLTEALDADWERGQRASVLDLMGDWSTAGVVEYLADLGVSLTYVTPVPGFAWKITVIAAAPPIAEDELYHQIAAIDVEVTMAGDCLAPLSALDAVYEGHAAARRL